MAWWRTTMNTSNPSRPSRNNTIVAAGRATASFAIPSVFPLFLAALSHACPARIGQHRFAVPRRMTV